ncbi:electron transfer flavoprotein-ubiquinone oxidoreductase [Salmonella enterica]|nr:electron transfer flavoprotein-ubiquinone oxidoreductase [Salmonella enterica]
MNDTLSNTQQSRETIECDVLIVGAGPAGLSAALKLKLQANDAGKELSIIVLDKGAEPGSHILSGAVMDPRALNELIPDWQERGAPIKQPVTQDKLLLLTNEKCINLPDALIPDNFRNHGNFIVSLGNLIKWLAGQAETSGVDIYAGFSATEILYDQDTNIIGVVTGDMGRHRDGCKKEGFQSGIEILAKYTIFAEGARGSLAKELIKKFHLDTGKAPQSFSIGIKELWEVPSDQSHPGLVIHTTGWPLDKESFGGGFLYHLNDNKIALGLVVGLDYSNPWLSPFQEMQRLKTHPSIRKYIDRGKRIGYGARAINNGGIASMPDPCLPGGLLIGCNAGTLNASRIKGIHTAIKSGMIAADAIFNALLDNRKNDILTEYQTLLRQSWLWQELENGSNFKPWFKKGRVIGFIMTGIEHWLLPRMGIKKIPWRVKNNRPDNITLQPANKSQKKLYDKPDGKLTFDILSSVYLSNTWHDDDQPVHLKISDQNIPISINLDIYGGPEERYCPAGVYEFLQDSETQNMRLQINSQNCIHCKVCDIKDPKQNITWTTPEGGNGPNYTEM